jgi:hypothetical protein
MSTQSTLRHLAVFLILAAGGFALTYGRTAQPSAAPDRLTQHHPEKRVLEPRTTWKLEEADPLVQFVAKKKQPPPPPPPPPSCSGYGEYCVEPIFPPCCTGLICTLEGDTGRAVCL